MRVAVSSLGPTLDDRVDEHFGRAMWFVVADTDRDGLEAIDNAANRNALQGAGIASAELISEQGVAAVITGHLGPKAFSALGAAGIPGYDGAGMTVRAALVAFAAGDLGALDEAGEAHSG
jgi:predicted Fe-Mo cluster-binding NifX family protein